MVTDVNKLNEVKETKWAQNFKVVEVDNGYEIRKKDSGDFVDWKPTYEQAELVRRQL